MLSFTRQTIQLLVTGAVVLGAGVYYQDVSSQRVDEARQALRSVDSAQSRLDSTRLQAERYLELLEGMASQKVDRQEPFAVDSEFSPQEIKQITPLLDTLYQRDGLFFLERFELAWHHSRSQQEMLPRVVLELEGEKVLLFSDRDAGGSAIAKVNR